MPRHPRLLLEHGHVDGAARDVAKAAAARGMREILVTLGSLREGEGVGGAGCGISGGKAGVLCGTPECVVCLVARVVLPMRRGRVRSPWA